MNKYRTATLRSITTALTTALVVASLAPAAQAELKPEAIGEIDTLPEKYPAHWMMVHDHSFFHMSEGEVLVIDPLGENVGEQYKGMMTASLIADYAYNRDRAEHYVIETFWSRGSRGGERTDVVTVYDTATLSVQAEIELPAKRISGMPKTTFSGQLDNGRFLAVYNFTPAQSVSVVDLKERAFVEEIPTPGCGFVQPNGRRSFTSICSNGSLLTTHLNRDGTLKDSTRSEILFDVEADPIFESAATSNGIAYFPTFTGRVLPINVRRDKISAMATWWLTGEDERNWRPGGLRPMFADGDGTGYVLMHADGAEGTHKNGGSEVWVYDLRNGDRQARIELKTWGVSIGSSGRGANRLLAVTNAEMGVDIYELPSGTYVRSLATEAATPFLVHGAE